MSALRLKQARGDGYQHWCQVRGCHKSGAVKVEMHGWPVGRVCTRHSGEWRRAWARALEPAVSVEEAA